MKKLKRGQKAIFIGNGNSGKSSSANSTPIGSPVLITTDVGCCGAGLANNTCNISFNGVNKGWAYDYELELIPQTKQELENHISNVKNEILEKEEEIKLTSEKIEFIASVGVDAFDDDEFKAHKVLKLIGIDDINKAKGIVKILNN